MWTLRVAQTGAEPHLARITCPALVINAEADTGVFPSDARRIYDALAGTDKSQASIDSDHYFTTPGARSEQADTIARRRSKRRRREYPHMPVPRQSAQEPCRRSRLARHPLVHRR